MPYIIFKLILPYAKEKSGENEEYFYSDIKNLTCMLNIYVAAFTHIMA